MGPLQAMPSPGCPPVQAAALLPDMLLLFTVLPDSKGRRLAQSMPVRAAAQTSEQLLNPNRRIAFPAAEAAVSRCCLPASCRGWQLLHRIAQPTPSPRLLNRVRWRDSCKSIVSRMMGSLLLWLPLGRGDCCRRLSCSCLAQHIHDAMLLHAAVRQGRVGRQCLTNPL